ncbi:MAG: radical SAM protein [Nanoarchaeota archaeon]
MKETQLPETYNYIAVFPTMRCNLDCGFCLNAFSNDFIRGKFNTISPPEWIDGLNRINTRKGVPITFGGGEPFVYYGFIDVINGIKSETEIDILTNLRWGKKGIDLFIEKVNPKRLKRNASYPSIRISYHPGQKFMDPKSLVEDAKRLQNAGFSLGIYSVQYPSSEQLQAITQMQFRCADAGILFRVKDFTGKYNGTIYGDYSKFPGATKYSFPDMNGGIPFLESREIQITKGIETKLVDCKTSELIIGPNADVYRCHRDLYAEKLSIGNLLDHNFEIKDIFLSCSLYGICNPCDVKVKTNYKQEIGNTSVEITNIKDAN